MDVDPGVDDSLALLLALRSPELCLIGVTTVFGNHTIATTTRNALDVLALGGRPNIPVAVGAAGPLAGEYAAPRAVVHGDNGLGGASLPPSATTPLGIDAADFIIEMASVQPGLTLVATAALTNLAHALEREPRLTDWVTDVVLMGGAYSVPGNITPHAEANIYHDPEAAASVFDAAWRVTAVGLDVTLTATLDDNHVASFGRLGTPVGDFAAAALPFYQRFYRERYGRLSVPIHDAVALAHVIDPTLLTLRPALVTVDTGHGAMRGQTRTEFVDARGRETKGRETLPLQDAALVATAVDATRFRDLLLTRVR